MQHSITGTSFNQEPNEEIEEELASRVIVQMNNKCISLHDLRVT